MNALVKTLINPFTSSTKILQSDFAIFLLGIFIYRAGWFMTLPFMAIFLSRTLGASPVAIGMVLGIGPLIACFTGFLAGSLVDRLGAKRIILISAFSSTLIFFLFCTSRNLVLYGVLNLFLAVFRSTLETACQTYVTHLLPEEQRSKGLSLRYMVINLSAGVGPLIGAKLILLSAQTLFIATGLIYLTTFIGFCLVLKSCGAQTSHKSYWSGLRASTLVLLRDKIAICIFMIEFFISATFAQVEITLPQILATRAIPHYVHVYSWQLVINALMIVVLQLPLDRIINKYSLIKTACISATLFFTAFVCFAFAKQTHTFTIATVLFTLAEMTGVTLCNIIIAKIAPPDMKGVYFGMLTLSMIGFSLSSLIGGVVLKYFGGVVLFNSVAVLSIICFAFLLILPRNTLRFKNT